ncbi:hypothetical protein [Kutzneria sp. NPDC052558]
MSVKFLSTGAETDLVALNVPVFMASTPAPTARADSSGTAGNPTPACST